MQRDHYCGKLPSVLVDPDMITKSSKGQRCPKRSCQCRLHDICIQNFFRVHKSKKCPLCHADWTGNDFVGERAVTAKEKQSQRKTNSGGSSARRGTQIVAEDAEDENDGET